jgi:hypothetical protein
MVVVVTNIIDIAHLLRLKDTTRFRRLYLSPSSGGAGKMSKLTVVGPSERGGFKHICSTYLKMEPVAACETVWALF